MNTRIPHPIALSLASLLALFLTPVSASQSPPAEATSQVPPALQVTPPTQLFEEAAELLLERYYDKDFRSRELPAIVERYRQELDGVQSRDDARRLIHRMLGEVPASHLGLLSSHAMDTLWRELAGKPSPTLGLELVALEDGIYVHRLLEKGAAEEAGLLRGDRILTVDGIAVESSPRLDWRTDDAYLPDPPLHFLVVEEGETVTLQAESRPGEAREVQVVARQDHGLAAAQRSARQFEDGGLCFGYIHFWLLHFQGPAKLLEGFIEEELETCDVLLLDLRGRGGSATMVYRIANLFLEGEARWRRPVIALIDGFTRSGKEILAWKLRADGTARLVGETTAGAVIPATFQRIGPETLLMFPSMTLGEHTDRLEGKGVQPDVPAADAGPFAAGADPILEAAIAEGHAEVRRRRLACGCDDSP